MVSVCGLTAKGAMPVGGFFRFKGGCRTTLLLGLGQPFPPGARCGEQERGRGAILTPLLPYYIPAQFMLVPAQGYYRSPRHHAVEVPVTFIRPAHISRTVCPACLIPHRSEAYGGVAVSRTVVLPGGFLRAGIVTLGGIQQDLKRGMFMGAEGLWGWEGSQGAAVGRQVQAVPVGKRKCLLQECRPEAVFTGLSHPAVRAGAVVDTQLVGCFTHIVMPAPTAASDMELGNNWQTVGIQGQVFGREKSL